MVFQKLDFVIYIVKQHTRAKLISHDRLEVQNVFVVVAFKSDSLIFKVSPDTYNVAFRELECLCLSECTLIVLFCSALMLFQLPPLELTM